MLNLDAFKTGLFCAQCGLDMPESRLFILYAKKAPTELVPDTSFVEVGRYCDECLPREKEMEIALNSAVEFRTEPFVARGLEQK